MIVRNNELEVRQSLSQSIRVNANPLTLEEWIEICLEAGLTTQQQQLGKMGLLNFNQMLRDEGLLGTIKTACNFAVNPNLRQRILQMRPSF